MKEPLRRGGAKECKRKIKDSSRLSASAVQLILLFCHFKNPKTKITAEVIINIFSSEFNVFMKVSPIINIRKEIDCVVRFE